MRVIARPLAFAAALVSLAACKGATDAPEPGTTRPLPGEKPGTDSSTTVTPPTTPPAAYRAIFDRDLYEVDQDSTITVRVRVVDSTGATVTGMPVTITTSDGAPVTVGADGVVTGLKAGPAVLEARGQGVAVDSAAVDVFGRPDGLNAGSAMLGSRPFGAGISKNGVLYVTRLDAGTMASVDVAKRSISGSIEVGSIPTGVTFSKDGKTAYVTNQGSGNVGVVDVATGRQVSTIPVSGAPFVVRVSPSGTKLYVTSNANIVSIVNLATSQVVEQIPVNVAPNGFAVTPDERRIYVSSAFGTQVTEFDPATDQVLRRFTVDGAPQELVVSKDGRELYVANEAGWVDVINLATGTVVARITLAGGGFGAALSPDQVHLYVSVPSAGVVQVVNTQSRRIIHTIAVGGRPRRIAFSYHGGIAVVANEAGSVDFVR